MLRIGTCSWKYESWKGLVYSTNCTNYLEEYSRKFNTVEIDQWFWSLHDIKKISLPDKKIVDDYANSVPDDFKFTIKIPNSITLTHFYSNSKNEPMRVNPYFLSIELFQKFLASIKRMHTRTGMLMFQFEYLNKLKMSSQKEFIQRFEKFISEIDRSFEYGIEIRNPNYLNKEFFDFLKRNDVRMVFLQGYYMPDVWSVFDKYKKTLEKTVVIRLHGGDRKGIEEKSRNKWNNILEPKDEEIKKVLEMIKCLLQKEVDIYLNVNNHYEGSAPLTIERIRKVLNKVDDKN